MLSSFRFGDMPPRLDSVLTGRLVQVETATLGHYLHDGFLSPALRPVVEGPRIAGPAVTVAIPGPDSALLYHALDAVRPGDILVIDRCGDERHACWGGFMAAAAAERGLAGVIVDGMVTDPSDLRRRAVPTWARGISPVTTKLFAHGGRFNLPVSVGGVAVSPGDIVLADDSGIVVLSRNGIEGLIDLALADQAEEGAALEKLRAGAKLADLADMHTRFAARARADSEGRVD